MTRRRSNGSPRLSDAERRVVRAAMDRFSEHLAFHGGNTKAAREACHYTLKARRLWRACMALSRAVSGDKGKWKMANERRQGLPVPVGRAVRARARGDRRQG